MTRLSVGSLRGPGARRRTQHSISTPNHRKSPAATIDIPNSETLPVPSIAFIPTPSTAQSSETENLPAGFAEFPSQTTHHPPAQSETENDLARIYEPFNIERFGASDPPTACLPPATPLEPPQEIDAISNTEIYPVHCSPSTLPPFSPHSSQMPDEAYPSRVEPFRGSLSPPLSQPCLYDRASDDLMLPLDSAASMPDYLLSESPDGQMALRHFDIFDEPSPYTWAMRDLFPYPSDLSHSPAALSPDHSLFSFEPSFESQNRGLRTIDEASQYPSHDVMLSASAPDTDVSSLLTMSPLSSHSCSEAEPNRGSMYWPGDAYTPDFGMAYTQDTQEFRSSVHQLAQQLWGYEDSSIDPSLVSCFYLRQLSSDCQNPPVSE